jgi:hypothetical protein
MNILTADSMKQNEFKKHSETVHGERVRKMP